MTPTNTTATTVTTIILLFIEFCLLFLIIVTPLLTARLYTKFKKMEQENKEMKLKIDEILELQRRQTYSNNYREYRQPEYNNNRNYNQSDRPNNNF